MSNAKQKILKRIPRFMSVTTKGGTGKSTCAQQILSTWLLSRLGAESANLIELDDQNLDSLWLKRSQIKTKQIRVDGDASFAILDLFDEFAGKPFVLDLGNQTAPDAIRSLGGSNRLADFDAIFVPVKDIGQDLINAERTINSLKEAEPDSKIVILLNGIMRQDPTDRRTRTYYGDIISYAEENGYPLMIMPGVEGYGMTRKFEMTIPEISANAEVMKASLNLEVVKHDREGNGAEGRKLNNMIQVINLAKDANKYIENLHKQIDQIIDWKQSEA